MSLPYTLVAGPGQFLAENNFGDTRSGGLAGPTGLVIILLLVVGTVLLIRNMNSRLRRLPDRFPAPPPRPTPGPPPDAGPESTEDPRPAGTPKEPPAASLG